MPSPCASQPGDHGDADEVRWRAFIARDVAADGRFVAAVRTTGVYCRPTCPARRPRQENVSFYPDPPSAEAAGFRPCRRCRPNGPDAAAEATGRALRHIEAHLDEPLRLADLGRAVGLSPGHLQRVFRRTLGVSPRAYVTARRLERLRAGLRPGVRVTDAVLDAGFASAAPAYREARRALGMTPAAYRRGGAGLVVRYTVQATRLGPIVVAATPDGVCAVRFLGPDEDACSALRPALALAVLERDDEGLAAFAAALAAMADRGEDRAALDLPLDVRATAFEMRVWQALRRIPRGGTLSYGEVAEQIGRPGAARAVARACAHNPVALAVPCHRVVRRGGALAGYRWGVERKRALLAAEASDADGGAP